MDHQHLPQPYSAYLTHAKNEISQEAVLAEQAIVLARPLIQGMTVIKVVAFFDHHTLGLLGVVDGLKDRASAIRDEQIEEAQREHVRSFGSLSQQDNDRLILAHQDYRSRLVTELDRYADILLSGLIRVIEGLIPDEMVEALRKVPLLAVRNGNITGVGSVQLDGFSLAVLVLLLFLGTLHAGVVLIAAGEWSHALAFLLANWGVMAIRFFDLVLRSRNGTFEKGLHYVEMIISAVLIGLVLNHCALELSDGLDAKTISKVVSQLLLGVGTVLVFHKLVWLLVRRLRDWKDRNKRLW
ncbi:MAG: hypothetical protein IPJ76_07410 [Flavobacteriales bacterium]|nr:MAG: hypothetical protein IPJ76_07410 [Flavobacteriales bacterium]